MTRVTLSRDIDEYDSSNRIYLKVTRNSVRRWGRWRSGRVRGRSCSAFRLERTRTDI